MNYELTFYTPTDHLLRRYRKRMSEAVVNKTAREKTQKANDNHLAKRINYMLIFSCHGRPGETKNTEVRYYFDWDIIVDNKKKTVVTMYQNKERRVPPASMFGDRGLRKTIYDLMFKPKSKIRKELFIA